jgi:small subunit ribosomal protein S8
MQLTDSIADMLTRIRNAASTNHGTVDIPASNVKKAIAQILLDEGYIQRFETVEDGLQGVIRMYAPAEKLPKVLGGLGIAIVSTSSGIMTDKSARVKGIGGEVLAYIW